MAEDKTPQEREVELIQRIATRVREELPTEMSVENRAALMADMTEEVKILIDDQVKQRIEEQAQRTSFAPDGQHSDVMLATELKNNRYLSTFRDIARDGYTRVGNHKLTEADLWLAEKFMGDAYRKHPERFPAPSDDLIAVNKALLPPGFTEKALTPAGAGTGLELIDTRKAQSLWADINLASRVVSNLGPTVDPMPADPFKLPATLGAVTFQKATIVTAPSAQDPATADSTLTTTEEIALVEWAYHMDEDAVVSMMPQVSAEMVRAGGEAMDDFALNADSEAGVTGNVNLDDAAPAGTELWMTAGDNGIRHQWIADNTDMTVAAGGDALVDADVISAIAKLGKYASNIGDVVCFMDIGTYLAGFLGLAETKSVDNLGSNATVIKTGQLGSYRGVSLIPSAVHRLAEADGKLSTTGTNNTLGSASFVNNTQWKVGFKRGLLVETDVDIKARKTFMVVTFRIAITNRGAVANNIHTSGIANILV